MCADSMEWQSWRRFFEKRSNRELPELTTGDEYAHLPESLARSLAVFQLGESGGGTIVEQARRSDLPGVDDHYAEAMALFVAEERRHANLLAICVRMLGGTLIRKNWSARLFVLVRRLIGIRFKVMVLLAAEVVGLCYYHLLAQRLPDDQLRRTLFEIADDEHAPLWFHCTFLRGQFHAGWQRASFVVVWRAMMCVTALVVLFDHRRALRDLELDVASVWRRWTSYGRLAERLVTDRCEAVTYATTEA